MRLTRQSAALLCWLAAAFLCFPARALVDMNNASYSQTFWDIPPLGRAGDVNDGDTLARLGIIRAYKSRTVFSGIFGFGWCSELETRIRFLPAGSIRLVECGDGAESDYYGDARHASDSSRSATALLQEAIRKAGPAYEAMSGGLGGFDPAILKQAEDALVDDDDIQLRLASVLGRTPYVPPAAVYRTAGPRPGSITVQGDLLVERQHGSDRTRTFDRTGRLVGMSSAGSSIRLIYEGDRPVRIEGSAGQRLELSFGADGKIKRIERFPDGKKSTYEHDARGDLVRMSNAWATKASHAYTFEYNAFHNLTRLQWPDGTFIRLAYDNRRDWVIGFRDRQGCLEDYNYLLTSQLHYESLVSKKCADGVAVSNHYEFWHKKLPSGKVVLERVRTRVRGSLADIRYSDDGKPVEIERDGWRAVFEYLADGRLSARQSGRTRWLFNHAADGNAASVEQLELAPDGSVLKRSLLAKDPWHSQYVRDAHPPADPLSAWHPSDEKPSQFTALRSAEKYIEALQLLEAWDAEARSRGADAAIHRGMVARSAQVLAEQLADTPHQATALKLAELVVSIAREVPSVDLARPILMAVDVHKRNNDPAALMAALEEGLDSFARHRPMAPRGETAPLFRALAQAQRERGYPAKALEALRRSGVPGTAADSGDAATAEILDDAGLPDQSLAVYRRSLAAFWAVLDPGGLWTPPAPDAASRHRVLGRLEGLAGELGRHNEALAVNQARMDALSNDASEPAIHRASLLSNRAAILAFAGRYADARLASDQALGVLEAHPDATGPLRRALVDRGLLESRLGNARQAADLLRRAIGLQAEPDWSLLANHASYLADLGNADDAHRAFALARERSASRLPPDHPSVANLEYLWAEALAKQQRPAEALALLEPSIRKFRQAYGIGHWRTARALSLRAQILLAQPGFADGAAAAREALDAAVQSGSAERRWVAFHGMSQMLLASGQRAAAILFGKLAVNEIQALRKSLALLESHVQSGYLESKQGVYRHLAGALVEEGRLAEAQQVLAMLKETELQDFTKRSSDADPRMTRADLLGSESRWGMDIAAATGDLGDTGRELAQLESLRRLGTLDDAARARRAVLRRRVDEAQSRFAALLERIREEAVAGGAQQLKQAHEVAVRAGNNLRDLVARASETSGTRTLALQYLVTDRKLHILVTTPEVQFAREVDISSAQLNVQIEALRRVLQQPTQDPVPAAQALFRVLMGPVARDLERAQAGMLMISLTGALRYVPFAALHDGRGYLVQRFRLAVMTEAAVAQGMERPRGNWNVAGLGVAARVSAQFAALPAVKQELMHIVRSAASQGVLPGEMYLDGNFTAARYRDVIDAEPSVIHIASHFKFTPGSDTGSFLLLGDGATLSLQQLMSEDYRFRNVQLLTLSACETALGGGNDTAGREVEGLAALAQKQGAPAVLATLWQVADSSTGELMRHFYRAREAAGGTSKAHALQQAQLALLEGTEARGAATMPGEPRGGALAKAGSGEARAQPYQASAAAPFAHPYFWAPFVLFGNWF